jgi:parvulin-like peptidyl-prolyl isomerase
MAKKNKVEKPRREVTKRQLSRWQQQKKRQRLIFGLAILVIVAVLSIVGVGVYKGWYVTEYEPLHETVIEVNDTKFDMDYYITMFEYYFYTYYYEQGIPVEYMEYVADDIVEIIEQNELIRQAAMELGISVSDDEVDEVLESYDPPLSRDYRDVIRTQMLLERMRDEYFEQQVPQSAEQRHIMAMFLESESQANEVRARIEAGEDFGELAAELSLDETCKEKEGDLGWRPEGVLPFLVESSILEENAFSCEVGVLSEPIYEESKTKMVGYWLIEVLERTGVEEEPTEEEELVEEESAKVRLMLLSSEQEADEVRARLEEGEDFGELAAEFSQHIASSQNGGEFEVTAKGMVSTAFDEFVFDPELELGSLSQPIRDEEVSTTGGYWLIEVVDVDDNRQLDEENRNVLKVDALNKWVEALWDDPDNNIVSYLDDEKKQWAVSRITGG